MKGVVLSAIRMGAAVALLGSPAALAQTNRDGVPPKPVLKSPVESFRTLLVMPSSERRQFIASRNTNVQQRLLEKIREYQGLTPEERELRLKATELRWYLEPLMRSPATNRAAQLELVPENLRGLVATRLEQWDRIPPPVQQMFLTNQQGAGYLSRMDPPTNQAAAPFPPHPPLGQIRERLTTRINQLFELTPAERDQVLATLSEAERQQMAKTWEAFNKLSAAQRRQCLLAFKQFTDLPPTERQEFIRNAERWSQMTPAQRQAWRELVSAAPNTPPGPFFKPPKPPVPTNPPPRKSGPSMATNGG